jgi:hypothetical protein
MPAVPGTTYYVTSYVSGWTDTASKAGNDISVGTTTVITIDNSSPSAASSVSSSVTSQEYIRIAYTNPSTVDAKDVVVLRSTSPVVAVPGEGVTYTVGNTIGASTVTCVKNNITLGAKDSCIYTTPMRQTSYYFKVFSKDTVGNYSLGSSPSFLTLIPSPNGGGFQFEAEVWNGGTATTSGGSSGGGDSGSGTGTSTNATTTTSTTTPGGGGGDGDIGFLYQGSNLVVQKESSLFSKLFDFLLKNQITGSALNVYAEEPQSSSSCVIQFYGVCIAHNVPSLPWLQFIFK